MYRQEMEEFYWRSQRHGDGPKRSWTGFTEFQVSPKISEEKIQEVLAANKGNDEVKESDIRPEEWPLWRVAWRRMGKGRSSRSSKSS